MLQNKLTIAERINGFHWNSFFTMWKSAATVGLKTTETPAGSYMPPRLGLRCLKSNLRLRSWVWAWMTVVMSQINNLTFSSFSHCEDNQTKGGLILCVLSPHLFSIHWVFSLVKMHKRNLLLDSDHRLHMILIGLMSFGQVLQRL